MHLRRCHNYANFETAPPQMRTLPALDTSTTRFITETVTKMHTASTKIVGAFLLCALFSITGEPHG